MDRNRRARGRHRGDDRRGRHRVRAVRRAERQRLTGLREHVVTALAHLDGHRDVAVAGSGEWLAGRREQFGRSYPDGRCGRVELRRSDAQHVVERTVVGQAGGVHAERDRPDERFADRVAEHVERPGQVDGARIGVLDEVRSGIADRDPVRGRQPHDGRTVVRVAEHLLDRPGDVDLRAHLQLAIDLGLGRHGTRGLLQHLPHRLRGQRVPGCLADLEQVGDGRRGHGRGRRGSPARER